MMSTPKSTPEPNPTEETIPTQTIGSKEPSRKRWLLSESTITASRQSRYYIYTLCMIEV